MLGLYEDHPVAIDHKDDCAIEHILTYTVKINVILYVGGLLWNIKFL